MTYAHPYQPDYSTPVTNRPHIGASSTQARNPSMDKLGNDRPSAYIRGRCPACFGGNGPPDVDENGVPHVIVALDRNFQLKRTKMGSREKKTPKKDEDTSGEEGEDPDDPDNQETNMEANSPTTTPPLAKPIIDPALPMNRSLQVAQEHAERWKKRAAELRTRRATTKDVASDVPDVVEPGMKVPNSALDGCEGSFTAADELREKASPRYFECMGVAAMVCKHDIPLFWMNIYTPGEGHFYAYAMIEQLMLHLPPSWLVGVLYDIGCAIHCSVVRWNILSEYLDRLLFAISVFHAYGHQWACQVWYHPRKQRVWGLTDGEGNERLWALLTHLVRILRVTGYYVRLWTLSMQINEIGAKFTYRLGDWQGSRIQRTKECLIEAQAKFSRISEKLKKDYPLPPGMSRAEWTRDQWDQQRMFQSQPIASTSISSSKKMCDAILVLEDEVDASTERIEKLQCQLRDLPASVPGENDMLDLEREDLSAELVVEKAVRKKSVMAIAKEKRALGLKDKQGFKMLADLKGKAVVILLLRIRAQRVQAQSLLRNRRMFQMNTDDRFRAQPASQRIRQHTDTALKSQRRKADRVIREHNKLVKEATKAAGKETSVPPPIDPKMIWSNDAADALWDDCALIDSNEFADAGGAPPWLASHRVQRAIRVEQYITNCEEELRRCDIEVRNMWTWGREQLEAFDHAIASRDENGKSSPIIMLNKMSNYKIVDTDLTMRYHLEHAKGELVAMLHQWELKLPPSSWTRHVPAIPPLIYRVVQVQTLGNDKDMDVVVEDEGEDGMQGDSMEGLEEFEELGVESGDQYGPDGPDVLLTAEGGDALEDEAILSLLSDLEL